MFQTTNQAGKEKHQMERKDPTRLVVEPPLWKNLLVMGDHHNGWKENRTMKPRTGSSFWKQIYV